MEQEEIKQYDLYLSWNRLGYTKINPYFATETDWNQTLVTAINQMQARIFQNNLRKGANMIITSQDNKSLFESLEYYDKEKETIGMSRYQVQYRNHFPDSLIIVCGSDDLNRCGYIILENKIMNQ